MKIHLLPIIFLLLISACKQTDSSHLEMDRENPTNELGPDGEETTSNIIPKEQNIINDTLVNQLESDLNEIILRSEFTIEKEATQNRHIENLTDTIITRTFKNSEIESYKTRGKEMIIQARITDPDFKFLNSVSVGSPKASLEKETGFRITSTHLKIENFTQNIAFIFKIENDNIEEIIYEGYVD